MEVGIDRLGAVVLEAKPLGETLLPGFGAVPTLPSVGRLPPPGVEDFVSFELPAMQHYEACLESRNAVVESGALLSHLGTYSEIGDYGIRRIGIR